MLHACGLVYVHKQRYGFCVSGCRRRPHSHSAGTLVTRHSEGRQNDANTLSIVRSGLIASFLAHVHNVNFNLLMEGGGQGFLIIIIITIYIIQSTPLDQSRTFCAALYMYIHIET